MEMLMSLIKKMTQKRIRGSKIPLMEHGLKSTLNDLNQRKKGNQSVNQHLSLLASAVGREPGRFLVFGPYYVIFLNCT